MDMQNSFDSNMKHENKVPLKFGSQNRASYFQGGNDINQSKRSEIKMESEENTEKAGADVDKRNNGKVIGFLDFIFTLSWVAIFFGMPLFFVNLTLQGLDFEKQIYFYFWLLVALIAWVVKGIVAGKLSIKRTPIDIPILAFTLFYLISMIFSVDKWHSFWGSFGDPSRGFANILALVVAYYLMCSNFTPKRFKWIIWSVTISGAIVSVWTLAAIFKAPFIPEIMQKFVPISLLGSASSLAMFLGLLIPIIILTIFKLGISGSISSRILSVALFLNVILNVVLLYLLSVFVNWVGIFVGIGIFLVFVVAKIVKSGKFAYGSLVLTFVFVVAIMMLGGGTPNLTKINFPDKISQSSKLSWEIAKEAAKNNFFLGSGPATYGYDFSLFKPDWFNDYNSLYEFRFYEGDGIIQEAIPTVGVIGAVLLILLVLSYVGVSFYLLSKNKSLNKIYSLGMFSSFAVFLFYASVSNIEGSILIFGTLVSILAIAILMQESGVESREINFSLETSPKYALAFSFLFLMISAGAVFIFVFLGKFFIGDVYAGLAVRQGRITENGSVANLLKAINLYSKEGRYYVQLGQEYMYLANVEMLKDDKDKDIKKIGNYLRASVNSASIGQEMMSSDVLSTEILAQIYENGSFYISESLVNAEQWYKKSSDLDPNNPNFYLKLGQIKTAQAQKEKDENKKNELLSQAKDFFQKSIDKKKDFALGYYNMSLIDNSLKNIDSSITNMAIAFSLDETNEEYAISLGNLYQTRGRQEAKDNKDASKDFNNAMALYGSVVQKNSNNIRATFSLAVLYEDLKKNSDAISEYEKVLSLLPESDTENKQKIQVMIDNVKNGKSNVLSSGENSVNIPDNADQNTADNDMVQSANEQNQDASDNNAQPQIENPEN